MSEQTQRPSAAAAAPQPARRRRSSNQPSISNHQQAAAPQGPPNRNRRIPNSHRPNPSSTSAAGKNMGVATKLPASPHSVKQPNSSSAAASDGKAKPKPPPPQDVSMAKNHSNETGNKSDNRPNLKPRPSPTQNNSVTPSTNSPANKNTSDTNANTSNNSTKNNPTKFRQDRPSQTLLRSSAARVDSFKSHGLSELSRQVRLAHAKNQAQASEIDRLERQLRILSDLKGISVADLRDTLKQACAGEAHADLRTQIVKLQAELDAAELIKQGKAPPSSSVGHDGMNNAVGNDGQMDNEDGKLSAEQGHDSLQSLATTAQQFEKEASDKAIANLQLRVGELEEVEEMLRKEIAGLYSKVQSHKASEATLTAKMAGKEAQIEELLKSLQVADEEKEVQRVKARAEYASKAGEAGEELRSAHAARERAETEAMKYKSELALVKESLRQAQLQAKIKGDECAILNERLMAREKDLQLKTDQFQSRSASQDERIRDVEQQLSSLYVAFGITEQDHGEENQRRSVLEDYLTSADGALAHQISEHEGGVAAVAILPVGTNVVINSPQVRGKRAVVVSGIDEDSGEQHVYVEETDETLSVPPECITPEATVIKTTKVTTTRAANPLNTVLASGYLLKRDTSGIVKNWKRRYFVLKGAHGIYNLAWGESGMKAKGAVGIATGVSRVTKTKQFAPSHKYCFALDVNPDQPKAPTLICCCSSRSELEYWYNVVSTCCTAGSPETRNIGPVPGSGHGNATTNQEMFDQEMANRLAHQGTEFS